MKAKIQKKHILYAVLVLSLFLAYTARALVFFVNARNVVVLCPTNLGIGFQNSIDHFVWLNVQSGILNCSDGRIRISDSGGSFRFTALNDTVLYLNYTVPNVKAQGDNNRELRATPPGSLLTIQAGNNVFITWSITIEPLLPLMFILGIFGLCGIIGGCLYTIDRIKKHDAYNGLVNGLIIVSLGISLFLAWLWAGVTV